MLGAVLHVMLLHCIVMDVQTQITIEPDQNRMVILPVACGVGEMRNAPCNPSTVGSISAHKTRTASTVFISPLSTTGNPKRIVNILSRLKSDLKRLAGSFGEGFGFGCAFEARMRFDAAGDIYRIWFSGVDR